MPFSEQLSSQADGILKNSKLLEGLDLDDEKDAAVAIEKLKQHNDSREWHATTINRVTAVINTILNKAIKEWQWLDTKPHIRKFKEPNIRIRWITQEEARRLIAHLPQHLAAMAQFTLATGLRESNVVGLEWNQIDMQRRVAWIHPDQTKSAKAIGVPLK